jgi:hypothetical protein
MTQKVLNVSLLRFGQLLKRVARNPETACRNPSWLRSVHCASLISPRGAGGALGCLEPAGENAREPPARTGPRRYCCGSRSGVKGR